MNFTMCAKITIRKANPLWHDKPRFRVQISGGARRYEGNNRDAPLLNVNKIYVNYG